MGFQDVLYAASRDQGAVTKRVYYQGTNTIYEGMALCYNHDTTDNVSGLATPTTVGTTAEGYQNEGKYFYVEEPSAANMQFPAGVVAKGSWVGTTGPAYVDVYIPNGSIVPVRTNANCTLGSTALGMAVGSNVFGVVTGDGDPAPMAIAMETVDRSSTNGLVLAKLSCPVAGLLALNAYFSPVRPLTTGDFYGIKIEGSNALTAAGTGGPRSYVVGIEAYKTSGAFTVAGNDDAGLRINMNCRVAAGAYYTFRGLNCSATNGNSSGTLPGTVATVENLISVANKSGSTAPTMRALSLVVENYGTCATELGGLKIDLRNEGAVATSEYGIWCHNSNNSIADSVGSVLKVSDTGANTGWDNLLDLTGVTGTIAAEDSLAYPDKAGSIKVLLPSGAAGYINIYDGVKA